MICSTLTAPSTGTGSIYCRRDPPDVQNNVLMIQCLWQLVSCLIMMELQTGRLHLVEEAGMCNKSRAVALRTWTQITTTLFSTSRKMNMFPGPRSAKYFMFCPVRQTRPSKPSLAKHSLQSRRRRSAALLVTLCPATVQLIVIISLVWWQGTEQTTNINLHKCRYTSYQTGGCLYMKTFVLLWVRSFSLDDQFNAGPRWNVAVLFGVLAPARGGFLFLLWIKQIHRDVWDHI